MATITITSDDLNAIQDVENFVTSLYQRGLPITHETAVEDDKPGGGPKPAPVEEHEVIATGKSSDFPDEPKSKR